MRDHNAYAWRVWQVVSLAQTLCGWLVFIWNKDIHFPRTPPLTLLYIMCHEVSWDFNLREDARLSSLIKCALRPAQCRTACCDMLQCATFSTLYPFSIPTMQIMVKAGRTGQDSSLLLWLDPIFDLSLCCATWA